MTHRMIVVVYMLYVTVMDNYDQWQFILKALFTHHVLYRAAISVGEEIIEDDFLTQKSM